jgi:hypothetical protein
MTSLALRKKLLLAESEVNRERFTVEYRGLRREVDELRDKVSALSSAVASAASVGVAGVRALSEARQLYSREKGSWLSVLLTGVRAGTSIWKSMRSPRN